MFCAVLFFNFRKDYAFIYFILAFLRVFGLSQDVPGDIQVFYVSLYLKKKERRRRSVSATQKQVGPSIAKFRRARVSFSKAIILSVTCHFILMSNIFLLARNDNLGKSGAF